MKIVKILLYILGALLLLVVLGLTYISLALPNVGEAPDLNVEITSEKVERGEYLAFHVMMCADCHAERDFSLFAAPPIEGTLFAGGEVFDQKMGLPGRFISPNITPAGVGDWTDGELYRAITTGVRKNGEPIFPVMPYHKYGQCDPRDIEAVIAYLRTLDPITTDHPESEADFPFNFILRTMPREAEPQQRPPKSDTLAYGAYLFTAAACGDCHTNFVDGEYVGPVGAGGREFLFPDGSLLKSTNITPHPTGIKNTYDKQTFIDRFKSYSDSTYAAEKVAKGKLQTIMPWIMYAGMTEEDLGAIYEYLQTLDPVDHAVVKYIPAEE